MYLDARGLVALWREGLLAQAVLRGATRGYNHHPQLIRFQEQSSPVSYIAAYLRSVRGEALSRGYRFAPGKIARSRASGYLTVPAGQLEFEWQHLMEKLRTRDPTRRAELCKRKSTTAASAVQSGAWRHRALGKRAAARQTVAAYAPQPKCQRRLT
jgi:hypothetical protein